MPCAEAGWNTFTVAVRVLGVDEKGTNAGGILCNPVPRGSRESETVIGS
jgi:hypothetical protein